MRASVEPITVSTERQSAVTSHGIRLLSSYLAVFGLLLAAVVGLQVRDRAYTAEFTSGGDAASHYITGLLFHDYLLSGLRSPIAFLRQFASHYPAVGIGHWGSLYYCIEAIWMLLFGSSRESMLLLSASVTAAIATICYAVAVRRLGRMIAWLVAAGFVVLPITQQSSGELMLDAPVALAALSAALLYARFLDMPSARRALWFALAALAAILIKGNGFALALLPPLSILIARRVAVLRVPAFWLPLPIVVFGAGPWYVFTWNVVAQGFRYSWGLNYVEHAAMANGTMLAEASGPVLLAVGLIGFVVCLLRRTLAPHNNAFVCSAALFASVFIFQSVVPADLQNRYLLPGVAPFVLLAGLALRCGADWLRAHPFIAPQKRWASVAELGLVAICVVALIPSMLNAEPMRQLGLIAAAKESWANLPVRNPAILIACDQDWEAAAVAELALNDPHRPSMFAIRGSRLLGGGGYNNSQYLPRFKTVEEVMAEIDAYRIPLVLLCTGAHAARWEHVNQVAGAAAHYPDRWQRIWQAGNGDGHLVTLYRIVGNETKDADLRRLVELSAPRALGGGGP